MPKIIKENNKDVRYWSDEELRSREMSRYRQGREDAGDKSQTYYKEEDLKEAYEKGAEFSNHLIGSAVRGAFEDGYHSNSCS